MRQGTLIFSERPLVAAAVLDTGDAATRGEAQAVALALLAMPVEATAPLCSAAHVAGTAEAASLATALEEFAAACPAYEPHRARHCLAVASVNVHAATRPTRGVLGVLSSMMEHSCSPSAMVTVGAEGGGSLLSLRTLRAVSEGEALSVSYVVAYQPTAARRQQLRLQHGFSCGCARCASEPELARCFVCPRCGEGPASPASSHADCRTLACTDCGGSSELVAAAWAPLRAAEASDDMSVCMRLLHPYHHKMLAAYRSNVGLVPLAGGQRAELFCQFADARIRLTSDDLDPLAAADLERAGTAFRAAGDGDAAARLFGSAGRSYAAHLGADSPEVERCLQALAALELGGKQRVDGGGGYRAAAGRRAAS